MATAIQERLRARREPRLVVWGSRGEASTEYVADELIEEAADLIDLLIEALRPFADHAKVALSLPENADKHDEWPHRMTVMFCDLRKALAAIEKARGASDHYQIKPENDATD